MLTDLKERWKKVDDRIKVLVKKYPLVAAVMIIVPLLLGMLIGGLLW